MYLQLENGNTSMRAEESGTAYILTAMADGNYTLYLRASKEVEEERPALSAELYSASEALRGSDGCGAFC